MDAEICHSFKLHCKKDRLQIPQWIREKDMQRRTIEPGLSYRIADYVLHTDLEYRRGAIR